MLAKIRGFIKKQADFGLTKNEAEFLPAALEVTETPPSPVGRLVLWTLFTLVIVGLAWTIFGYVDEVAVAPGKIIPTGFVKVVQVEDKGVVKTIHVQDGQKVKQGQILLELDPTFNAADVARIKKEVAYNSLEIERLLAERDDRGFNPVIQPGVDIQDIQFQMSLYSSRVHEFKTKMSTAEANIRQNEAQLEVSKVNKVKFTDLLEIARDKETRIQQLIAENAVALFVLLDHKSRRMELEQSLAAQNAEIARNEAALQQSRENRVAIIAERNRDIDTKLVDSRRKLFDYREELKKVTEKDRLSRITAPVDGRVTQLAVHTVGGVVTAAQPIMVIVPEDATLEVEAWAANKDVGFIREGQPAEIKVETFSFQKYGTIDAQVIHISPDAVEDKDKGRVYRVLLKPVKNTVVVEDKLVYLSPGMSATAEIKIKQKRIIEFFLDPFRQYQSEALRER